jgi:hypothetical protein
MPMPCTESAFPETREKQLDSEISAEVISIHQINSEEILQSSCMFEICCRNSHNYREYGLFKNCKSVELYTHRKGAEVNLH